MQISMGLLKQITNTPDSGLFQTMYLNPLKDFFLKKILEGKQKVSKEESG